MDTVCCYCGEPWGLDYILHEDRESFALHGAAVVACPSCSTCTGTNQDGKREFTRRPDAVRHPRSRDLYSVARLSSHPEDFASDLADIAGSLLDPATWSASEREEYRTAKDARWARLHPEV